MHSIRLAFAVLICVGFLSGCQTISPLKSKPPYRKITMNQPYKDGDGFFVIQSVLPIGDYQPVYEDEEGYFYQAPQKITGKNSFFPTLLDGGVYLRRGLARPDRFYLISAQGGIPTKLLLKNRADLTMVR